MTTISKKQGIMDLLVSTIEDKKIKALNLLINKDEKTSDVVDINIKEIEDIPETEIVNFLNRSKLSLKWGLIEIIMMSDNPEILAMDALYKKKIPENLRPFTNREKKYLLYLIKHPYIYGDYMLKFNAMNPLYKFELLLYFFLIFVVGTLIMILTPAASFINLFNMIYTYYTTGYNYDIVYWILGLTPFVSGFMIIPILDLQAHYKYMAMIDKGKKITKK